MTDETLQQKANSAMMEIEEAHEDVKYLVKNMHERQGAELARISAIQHLESALVYLREIPDLSANISGQGE